MRSLSGRAVSVFFSELHASNPTFYYLQAGGRKEKGSAPRRPYISCKETLLLPEDVPVIPFSAEKGTGREQVLALIESHIAECAGASAEQ